MLATPHLGYVTWETYESYFAVAFSIGVEMLNIRMLDRRAARAPIQLRKHEP